jgi:hypothetical protein
MDLGTISSVITYETWTLHCSPGFNIDSWRANLQTQIESLGGTLTDEASGVSHNEGNAGDTVWEANYTTDSVLITTYTTYLPRNGGGEVVLALVQRNP